MGDTGRHVQPGKVGCSELDGGESGECTWERKEMW